MPNLENRRSLASVRSYPELLRKVRETLVLGQQSIEQEKVKTYWETGRSIHAHLLHHEERAEYGERVIQKLANDLDVGKRLLERCLRFYRQFPHIASERTQLNWTHFRALLAIPDEERRFALAKRAERLGWTSPRLEQVVKRMYQENGRKTYELLEPRKGTPYLYQIRAPQPILGEAELKIDLGFRVRRKLSEFKVSQGVKLGDLVESRKRGKHYEIVKAKDKTAKDLFTYRAGLLRVVDGDTLYVEIDLGFGDSVEEYLRLRGIDAPEINTPQGRRVKAFVEKELATSPVILLRSSQTDQWDRYVADVFYTKGGTEHFLNNRLLEEKLAKRLFKTNPLEK